MSMKMKRTRWGKIITTDWMSKYPYNNSKNKKVSNESSTTSGDYPRIESNILSIMYSLSMFNLRMYTIEIYEIRKLYHKYLDNLDGWGIPDVVRSVHYYVRLKPERSNLTQYVDNGTDSLWYSSMKERINVILRETILCAMSLSYDLSRLRWI